MANGTIGASQLELLTQDGTGTITVIPPATNTDRTLTFPDETGTLVTTASLPNPLTSGTAVAATSGTAIDFTGIPSWVKRVTVLLFGVSTNSTSPIRLQIGDSEGIETSGYQGVTTIMGVANLALSAGFDRYNEAAAAISTQEYVLTNLDSNNWVCRSQFGLDTSSNPGWLSGRKTTSGTLDRIRITTVGGTSTFDAGSINIMYE